MSLFDSIPLNAKFPGRAASAPLAERMRPRSLEEFAGQEHILGPGKLLRRAIELDPKYAHAHAWHLYTPLINIDALSIDRDAFMQQLKERNIGAGLHYVDLADARGVERDRLTKTPPQNQCAPSP